MNPLDEVNKNSLDDIFNEDPSEMKPIRFEQLVEKIRNISRSVSQKPPKKSKKKVPLSKDQLEDI